MHGRLERAAVWDVVEDTCFVRMRWEKAADPASYDVEVYDVDRGVVCGDRSWVVCAEGRWTVCPRIRDSTRMERDN